MDRSLASKIEAANTAILSLEDLDAVGDFFARDYVADLDRFGRPVGKVRPRS